MKTLLAILLITPTLASAQYNYVTKQDERFDLEGARRAQQESMLRQQQIQMNGLRQMEMQQNIMMQQRMQSAPPPQYYGYPPAYYGPGRW